MKLLSEGIKGASQQTIQQLNKATHQQPLERNQDGNSDLLKNSIEILLPQIQCATWNHLMEVGGNVGII